MIFRFLIPCLFLYTITVSAELAVDKTNVIETLPVPYPKHWVIIHDVAFYHMQSGRLLVVDPEQDRIENQVKGMMDSSFIAMFAESARLDEMYVLETFYSRGTRGERTDLVTIYDKSTLKPVDEIVLPVGKRASMMPSKYTLYLVNDDRFLLIYSFTPSASILVVDTDKRKLVNEISLPSCALIYPTGKNGFSSLCGNASMISFELDDNGQVKKQSRLDPFFDIDKDALFERPAIIDGIAYFPTFNGYLQEIDLSGTKAKLGKRWSLLTDMERELNWRPGGMQFSASDALGRMYVLMHKDGYEGSHKDPGTEVWVYDVKKKKRVQKIQLEKPTLVLELTKDNSPLLFTTNIDFDVDVYDAKTGKFKRSLANIEMETPFIMYSVR